MTKQQQAAIQLALTHAKIGNKQGALRILNSEKRLANKQSQQIELEKIINSL